MLCASRLSEMHALGVQALLGGTRRRRRRGCRRAPVAGPPPQPERHDAASATAPSATTQIRLATADLPAPPAAWQRHEAKPLSGAWEVPFHQAFQSRLRGTATPRGIYPKPSRRSCRMTGASSLAEIPHIRWQTSARNHPTPCHSN